MECLFARDLDDVLAEAVELGTHHEEQHQELVLMDIKHVLSMNPAVGPAHATVEPTPSDDPGPVGWVGFEGGCVTVGRECRATGGGFAFETRRCRRRPG